MPFQSINAKIGKLIKYRREELGISQQHLAAKMNLPRPTVSQIENGQRKITAEELVKLSKILNLTVNQILGTEEIPDVILNADKVKEKPAQYSVRISVPRKNLSKFKEVLLYILNKVGSKPNIGETVLYKLLYFIDFDFYEKYEEQMMGATYIKNHYGPTPVEFNEIIKNMMANDEIIKVKSSRFNYPQTKYLPLRKPDLSKLKAHELELIDTVLERLSDKSAREISDYSHNDVPWIAAKEGDLIEYESVFYRTPAYSVREYKDDI